MRLSVALAALVLATPLAAQEFEPDCAAAEEFLGKAVEQGRTVGASVLIWQGSEEACFAASGDAVREEGKAFSRDTLVQVFSMTKPVTGVALMQLWEKGAFGLDDPLQLYLPEYRATRVLTGEREDGSAIVARPRRAITVRDVLRHTAGFSYGPGGEPQNAADRAWQELDPLSADNTLAQFSQKLAQVPLLYEPGTHWSYSAGVDVQARLIEVLSGQPFDGHHHRIFAGQRVFHCSLADRISLFYICGGSDMPCRALQVVGHGPMVFVTQLVLDHRGQGGG